MDIKATVQEFISGMNSHEKVYKLFWVLRNAAKKFPTKTLYKLEMSEVA